MGLVLHAFVALRGIIVNYEEQVSFFVTATVTMTGQASNRSFNLVLVHVTLL